MATDLLSEKDMEMDQHVEVLRNILVPRPLSTSLRDQVFDLLLLHEHLRSA
jgi:hypothetical protein